MMARPAALALSLVAVGIAAVLAMQIVAGWPLSPRLNGPALLALTIGASAGLAFLAGIDFTEAATTWARAAALLGLALSIAGAWSGAAHGLMALAAGFAALLLCPPLAPARVVLAIGTAIPLMLAGLFGPF